MNSSSPQTPPSRALTGPLRPEPTPPKENTAGLPATANAVLRASLQQARREPVYFCRPTAVEIIAPGHWRATY